MENNTHPAEPRNELPKVVEYIAGPQMTAITEQEFFQMYQKDRHPVTREKLDAE